MRTITKCMKNLFKYEITISHRNNYCTALKPPWKIMFFGTDEFSVSSLKCLNHELKTGKIINNLEVVTSNKAKLNPVRTYALKENLSLHAWPLTVLERKFDLGIVVSFGHLIPDSIINKFPLGIINVHASLLPRWRGAAPIIHTIANGDKITGVTIMKIQPKKFDIGEILAQQQINIPDDIKMPELYRQLSTIGANLLINCLNDLTNYLNNATKQPNDGITYAPKVTPQMSRINWETMSSIEIYNLSRALDSLYPLTTKWNNVIVKLFDISIEQEINDELAIPGRVKYIKNNKKLIIQCSDNKWISCSKVGLPGKKPMYANDFNNGYIKKELLENRLFK